MPSLYSQISGEKPLVSGSPEYESRIVEGTRRTLAPQYAQAIKQARQTASNRGLYSSPVGMQEEASIGQDFRNKMFDASQRAATGAADIAEENRRSAIARAFALQQQQAAYDQQNRMADREDANMQNQLWASLLGGAAGGVGNILGGAIGNSIFSPRGGNSFVPDSEAPDLSWLYDPRVEQQMAAYARAGR